ncbi:hypothetical protein [Methanococcoides sp. LMO-2]|uniref:Uncharacterized protein n=1 Tax=Methanococcoides cohabitans TaxID=3136559 RepID=A0ABU9KTH5_9EURY
MIMALFFTAISDLKQNAEEDSIQTEIAQLVSNAEQIYIRGEGSLIYIQAEIPENAEVHLGKIPDEDEVWPSNSNNYYILIDGHQKMFESKAAFSNSNMTGPYTIGPGHHNLKLETQRDNTTGMLVVKISE